MEPMRELNPEERKEVRTKYADIYFPSPSLEPAWAGRRNPIRIPGKKAIVDQNAKDFTVFGICSDQYKIIHYEDIVKFTETIIKDIKGYGEIVVKPSTYASGAKLRVGLSFPEKKISIVKGDNIIPKIDIFSSYDLSTMLKGRFGAFQLKCTNGMGVWNSFKQFAKRHLQNLFLEDMAMNIEEGLGIFTEQTKVWKEWSKVNITQKQYDTLWETLPFSHAEKEKIEALPEIGTKLLLPEALKSKDLNLWSMQSVLTQFSTHEVKSELRRIDLEPLIAKSMEMAYEKFSR